MNVNSQLIGSGDRDLFLSGVNIAWNNYGWDFGWSNRTASNANHGWNANWWDNTFS
jgi:hypothetical protein